MIDAAHVSAVIVTRGDVDLTTILASLPFDDVVVWDNNVEEDLSVYGRFAAVARARHDVIYTQDDDCLVPVAGLLRAYDGRTVVNVPDDEKPLLGWGAVFPRENVDCLDEYCAYYGDSGEYRRCADVVFTALTPWARHHVGHRDLPWARGPERMYWMGDHYTERERVVGQARALRHYHGAPVG